MAHGIQLFAHVHGGTIEGEAHFRGDAPVQNATVTAFDRAGKKIGQTTTDENGEFSLEARFRCDHRLVVGTGDGHGAEYTIAASQLPKELPPRGDVAPRTESHSPDHTHEATTDHEHLEIIRAEIVELRRQLSEHQQRIRLQDVLGGIGYIVGVAGLAFYFLGVRRQRPGPPV